MIGRIFAGEHVQKRVPGHVLAGMLDSMTSELRVSLADVLGLIEADRDRAPMGPFDEFIAMDGDEIVSSHFVEDDPMELVFPDQIAFPRVSFIFRKSLEPAMAEMLRIKD